MEEGDESELSRFSEDFPDAAVLFIDVAGGAAWTRTMSPLEHITLLNSIFTALDEVITECAGIPEEAGVFKGGRPVRTREEDLYMQV